MSYAGRVGIKHPFLRMAIYLLVILGALFLRGRGAKEGSSPSFPPLGWSDTSSTVTLQGIDLSPVLVPKLISSFEAQFPANPVRAHEGGTARALEALATTRANVGLLYRPPTLEEQKLIRAGAGDTVDWYPVALGGILVLAGNASDVDSLTLSDLRSFLGGAPDPRFDRLYAPDPNQGLWDIFLSKIGNPVVPERDSTRVIYLVDETAVSQAVEADPRSVGIASSLGRIQLPAAGEVHGVALRSDTASVFVPPTDEAVAYGEYPLFHTLYVACFPYRSLAGSRFVTYLTSDRGQRAVDRAGFIPVRIPLREIHLSQKPPGSP